MGTTAAERTVKILAESRTVIIADKRKSSGDRTVEVR